MNPLYKTGEYVLLSDCEAYDKKYGLEKDATMWMVARKMEGGEPNSYFMRKHIDDSLVGICNGDVGVWDSGYEESTSKLTVQEALYRSENGLTLDELAKIPCGFESGKEYVCTWVAPYNAFEVEREYKANGRGIYVAGTGCNHGVKAKFKPLPKPESKEWVPSVGDEVVYYCSNPSHRNITDRHRDYHNKNMKVVGMYSGLFILSNEDYSFTFMCNDQWIKPTNKERERVINEASKVFHSKCVNDYSGQPFLDGLGALCDAGMLKLE